MKIAIVEDERLFRDVLRKTCAKDLGHEVVGEAGTGREALEVVEKARPDLVVMDVSMPGIDGIEAMSRMLAKDHKLPIILNTAYATYRESFRSWSADAYVVKSSDLTELKDTIKKVLELRSRPAAPAGA